MEYKLKNGSTLLIREATVADAETILHYFKIVTSETNNLLREPSEFTMTVDTEIQFLEKVQSSPHEAMLIAFVGDTLVATAGVHGSALNRIKHRVSLGISVLMEYHHQGIGTIMMEALIQKAKEMGKRKIELDVREDNTNAIKLYEKVGFVKEGLKRDGIYDQGTYINLVEMGLFI